MSKFLKLVKENRPGEDTYTVELKNEVTGNVLRRFAISGVGSPIENFLAFEDSVGGVEVPTAVEDQEEELTTDSAIEAAAERDPDSPAGKAVEDRKRKVDALVTQYIGNTNKL